MILFAALNLKDMVRLGAAEFAVIVVFLFVVIGIIAAVVVISRNKKH